ncbi:MAG: SDR family oxidoreductase [Bacteroidales bacterium]|nr:SDR family oxidoreductase [Bacteroidales bacterium]
MVILITGISSGFGLAMAQRLCADGHTVYGTVRREVEQLPGVHYLRADVRDTVSVQAAVEAVLAAEGRIDVLVNNAGMGIGGPVEFAPEDDVELQMDTNFMGQVRFTQAVLPAMRRQGSGKILCFSSIGGVMGLPFQGFYSASKFAIEGFCEALQIEVRRHGIQVILIEPGDFSTGFTAARIKQVSEEAAAAYPSLKQSVNSFEKDEQTGLRPEYLASKIAKIVRRKHPKFRYVIATFIQKLSIPLKRILPARTFVRLLSLFYKVK